MKDDLILTGCGIVISVCLVGMAWSYGEYKKIEGREESVKEFRDTLSKLRIELLKEETEAE